jgi:hypothetical protein
VWLTQAAMSELFDCSSDKVSLHLKNTYETGELQSAATTEDFSVVRQEGPRQVSRLIKHYNLDAIIAVGHEMDSLARCRFSGMMVRKTKKRPSPNENRHFTT